MRAATTSRTRLRPAARQRDASRGGWRATSRPAGVLVRPPSSFGNQLLPAATRGEEVVHDRVTTP